MRKHLNTSRKIISYSLFGSDEKYSQGAIRNCQLIKKLLPKWTPRIYYSTTEFKFKIDLLSKLTELHAELVDVDQWTICGKSVLQIPYLWRCFAFFNYDIVLCRDLDSFITPREVDYIKNWLDSEKPFFIIRDHPWQGEIGAGLLGLSDQHQHFVRSFLNFFNTTTKFPWGYDEVCLRQFKERISNPNDVYLCSFETQETYIPRIDKNTFIGLQCDALGKPTHSGVKALDYLKELNL